MELRHLIYFRAVARLQHVSRAAEELSVSQPAVSRQLKELQTELGGVELFRKVGRGIKLTPAGELLQAHVDEILRHVEEARIELTRESAVAGGRVRIGAPPTVGERLLPRALGDFHRRHPAVDLLVHEGSSSTLLRMLYAGEIDMAVVTAPVNPLGMDIQRLFAEELIVVLALEHRLADPDRRTVKIADLRDEHFLLYSPGGYVRDATLQACRAAGFTPRVTLDSGSMELLLQLAEAGLGVAVVPELALAGRERLKRLRLIDPPLTREMVLVSQPPRLLTYGAELLRDHLAAELPKLRPR
ncbi:MAG: LysR family transcriptional regulator [Chloroflexi bacterium OHK40]